MPKKEYELFEWKVFAFKRSDVPVFLLKLVNSNYFLIQPSFRDANILHQVVSSHEFMHLRSSYPVNLHIFFFLKSSVIRQNGESQNRCFKKTKHAKFSEKRTFLTPLYGKIWRALFSWNTRFEIRSFALLPAKYNFLFE